MYRRNKVDYGKYLGSDSSKKRTKKELWKLVWTWTKVFLFIFLITSMLWGCVQMFQTEYYVGFVTDMSGSKFYNSGMNFEIDPNWHWIYANDISYQGPHKTFWFVIDKSNLISYDYNVVTTWGESFSKTHSPYYGFFVYPMLCLLNFNIQILNGFGKINTAWYGAASILGILGTCILIKSSILAMTWKTQFNQDKALKFQGEQAKIKNKYKNETDKESRQNMQIEIMKAQKKLGYNPLSSFATMLMSTPIIYSLYTTIKTSHLLKTTRVGKIYLNDLPWDQITQGKYIYLIFFFLYVPIQLFSGLLPIIFAFIQGKRDHEKPEAKKARKKQMYITIGMSVVFVFVISKIPVGVCIYWIFSSFYQILQTTLIHFIKRTTPKRILKKREKAQTKTMKKIETRIMQESKLQNESK